MLRAYPITPGSSERNRAAQVAIGAARRDGDEICQRPPVDILRRSSGRPFGRVEAIALGVYAALAAWVTIHHQPWADEAQAWLLARDSGLRDLFLTRLHYEGHPGLWHLLLWVLARLHGNYAAMQWAAVLVGVVSAWMILRYAPFSLPVRILLIFGYSLFQQTAIIARNYSLAPLLIFVLCVLLESKRDRPVVFALMAGLLANTALASAVISAGFVAVYFWKRGLRAGDCGATSDKSAWLLKFSVVLLLFWVAAIFTALPAPDESARVGPKLAEHPAVARALSRLTGIPIPRRQPNRLQQRPSTVQVAIPADKPHGMTEFQDRLWILTNGAKDKTIAGRVVTKGMDFVSILFYTVSQSNLWAAFFYIILLAWIYTHDALPAVIPLFMGAVAGSFLGLTEHHIVLIWSALVAGVWIAQDADSDSASGTGRARIDTVFGAVLLVVLVEQCCWTAAAIRFQDREPFDGSRAAAQFIQDHVKDQPIAAFNYYSIAVQPYFRDSVFVNQKTTYWPWSIERNPDLHLREVVGQRPPYILLGEAYYGNSLLQNQLSLRREPGELLDDRGDAPYLMAHGYREKYRFCGKQPVHFGYSEQDCELILEPMTRREEKQ
ncbi:MAG TPA: hypothetical protein VHZ09_12945 [Acidobacteriaceae bacterium]|nr:hypothetical protein [Acidobacteriaceae bacterium]